MRAILRGMQASEEISTETFDIALRGVQGLWQEYRLPMLRTKPLDLLVRDAQSMITDIAQEWQRVRVGGWRLYS